MSDDALTELTTHRGGCHCGAVQWQVLAPAEIHTHTCNCSLCDIQHYQHLIVPKQHFTLLSGEANLSTYTFGSGIVVPGHCRLFDHCKALIGVGSDHGRPSPTPTSG